MNGRAQRANVLVIGAGAAGGIVAKVLADAGLRVVCLDQGPWFRPEAKSHWQADWEWRRATWWATEVNVRGLANDYPVDTDSEHTLMWNGVGGSTTVYTAVWPRLRPSDLRKAIPPRSRFPVPPPAHGALGERAGKALDRLGWHRWPMPVAILGAP